MLMENKFFLHVRSIAWIWTTGVAWEKMSLQEKKTVEKDGKNEEQKKQMCPLLPIWVSNDVLLLAVPKCEKKEYNVFSLVGKHHVRQFQNSHAQEDCISISAATIATISSYKASSSEIDFQRKFIRQVWMEKKVLMRMVLVVIASLL